VHDNSILIVGADDIGALLAGREQEVMDTVGRAYRAHGAGQSSLPHSTFLRFPANEANRIIALPAFLGDGFQVAGMKWIASFPGNLERDTARASAVLVLNSCATGHPEAILEGSLISAERTAASAALAARVFLDGRPPAIAGFIGAGLINRWIARSWVPPCRESITSKSSTSMPGAPPGLPATCARLLEGPPRSRSP
jgi:ornithine cyclodeaminase/alanine dehydrogenase-like protein (mu-crystallin family)